MAVRTAARSGSARRRSCATRWASRAWSARCSRRVARAARRGPNETNAPNNRRRKTYSALYTYQQFLDYQEVNEEQIERAIDQSIRFQRSNRGRIVFRGSHDIPAYPAPHPGEAPPPAEPPEGVLETPPCGYLLTEAQYSGPQPDGPPVGERLDAHGIRVSNWREDAYFVSMRQPQRGLIPLLLDGEAAEPMVAARRMMC